MTSQQPASGDPNPNWLLQLARKLRLAWHLLRDPSLPLGFKLIPIAAVVYVLFPGDLLPDFIPGLGQIDDLSLALLALKLFIDVCPASIVAKHEARMSSVAASFRVIEDDTGSDGSTERRLRSGEACPPTEHD